VAANLQGVQVQEAARPSVAQGLACDVRDQPRLALTGLDVVRDSEAVGEGARGPEAAGHDVLLDVEEDRAARACCCSGDGVAHLGIQRRAGVVDAAWQLPASRAAILPRAKGAASSYFISWCVCVCVCVCLVCRQQQLSSSHFSGSPPSRTRRCLHLAPRGRTSQPCHSTFAGLAQCLHPTATTSHVTRCRSFSPFTRA
jgi:hypothetical protein